MSRSTCTRAPSPGRGMVASSVALATVLLASAAVAGAGKAFDPGDPSARPVVAGPPDGGGQQEPAPFAFGEAGDPVAASTVDRSPPRASAPAIARSGGAVAEEVPAEAPAPVDAAEHDRALVPPPHDPDAAQVPAPDGTPTPPEPPAANAPSSEPPAANTPSSEPQAATGGAEPAAPAPATTIDGATWDRLAACESGHGGPPQWDHNRFHHLDPYSDARFYGGLHFNKMSWDWAVEVGGHDVPYWPHEASRAQQIAVAETLRRIHPAGWGAWPECSRRVGLR